MFSSRIESTALRDRLDAPYYSPDVLANEKVLVASGATPLRQLIDVDGSNYGVLPPSEDYLPSGSGVPLIRGGDLDDGGIRRPEVDAPLQFRNERGTANVGDVLLLIKGACIDGPAGVALVSERHAGSVFNGSCYRIKVLPGTDAGYLVAYCQTKYLLLQKRREIANTGISYNGEGSVLGYLVPRLASDVQRYVGDKVRQAERFRGRASVEKASANELFEAAVRWDPVLGTSLRSRRISVASITNRLDANFNSPSRLRLAEHLLSQEIATQELDDLVEVSAMIGWKGLTTENYVSVGPWLLRGVEIDDGFIRFEDLVCVEQTKYDEQPQIHLREGDVAMTKDGTIGKAIAVPFLKRPLAAGSTVARLRVIEGSGLSPFYLEHVLNHRLGQIQIASYATGMAQPHITQEWIAKLRIPRVSAEPEIARRLRRHHDLMVCAEALMRAAVVLVESLVEGALDEEKLRCAHAALEAGDNSLDRALLQPLKRGKDQGAPTVFADLDALYALADGEDSAGGRD